MTSNIISGGANKQKRKTIYYLQNRVDATTILSKPNDSQYTWNIKKSTEEELYYNFPIESAINAIDKYRDSTNLMIKETNSQIINMLMILLYQYSPIITNRRKSEIIDTFKTHNKSKDWFYVYKSNFMNNSILKNRFIYDNLTFFEYYINHDNNILPINIDNNTRILEISHHLSYSESVIVKILNENINVDVNKILHTELITYFFNGNYLYNDIESMNYLYNYHNISEVKLIWSPKELERKIEDMYEIDIGMANNYVLLRKYPMMLVRLYYNHMLILGSLIMILSKLKTNGKLVVQIPGAYTKFAQDLIYIITQHFETTKLIDNQTMIPIYTTIRLLADRFKPSKTFDNDLNKMKQLYKNMYKNDPSGGLNYVPSQNNVVLKTFIIKPPKSDYIYYNSLINVTDDTLFIQINTFCNNQIKNYKNFVDKLIFYYNDIYNNREKVAKILNINYHNSIQMARKIGLELNTYLDENRFTYKLANDIYRDLYNIDSIINYKFKYYKKPLMISNMKLYKVIPILMKQSVKINNIITVLESRNYNIEEQFLFYEKLNKMLVDQFNIGINIKNKIITPSKEWCKIYEILSMTKLIPKNRSKYNISTINDDGTLILAVNHYIKTKTQIKTFNWTAHNDNNYDKYKLIDKYPYNWNFDKLDNIYNNIDYVIDLMIINNNINFFGDLFNNSKKIYEQLIYMLNNLQDNKNFIIKYEMSFLSYPAHLGLLYIIYQSFDELSFHKSIQDDLYQDIYIIGKKYKKINFKQLDSFIFKKDDYNMNESPVNINKLPSEFLLLIEKGMNCLISIYTTYIEKIFYYIDIIENNTQQNINIKKQIDICNNEWVNTFDIKPIKNTDKLV